MPTAESVYASSVAVLPKSEQLKLAALILDELSASAAHVLDFSDSWDEEDLRDVTSYAADYAAKAALLDLQSAAGPSP
jgi:hypothetical protein